MKTSESEKLWSISILDGRAKVFRNSIPLKSNNNGREYGFLLGVPVKVQSAGDKFIQVRNNLRCLSFIIIYYIAMSLLGLLSSKLCHSCRIPDLDFWQGHLTYFLPFPKFLYVPSELRQSVVPNNQP